MNFIKAFTISIMVLIIFTSCSGGAKTPVSNDSSLPNSPETLVAPSEDTNHDVLSVYDAVIDPAAKTFTVTPVQRVGTYHFPLSRYFPNVLQITSYGFTPNFWADIKLTHPYPGSGIDAFDPRVIAILPARPGVSFIYPALGVGGNNKALYDPDGYTKLFDNLGGSIPGNVNPFKAYFKDQPNRVWSSTGVTQETQRWQMNLSGFGGPIQFKLVVDVSTNYPSTPTPVTDNAPEPVKIVFLFDGELTTTGGSLDVYAILLDWQGSSSISTVSMEAPDLFDGIMDLSYVGPGPNPDQYVYYWTISNQKLAPEGSYKLVIAASDMGTGIMLYNEFDVYVQGFSNFFPIDVTSPWLDFSAEDVFIDGNYMYVAGEGEGLFIYDASNNFNPVNNVNTPGIVYEVYVISGYAYVADSSALQIIDIEPPESAYIVKSVDTLGSACSVHVSDGYAYVAGSKFEIIDIEPIESSYVVKSVDLPVWGNGVYVSGDYAYVADGSSGLQIIDIEPPASAYIVKTVDTPGRAYGVQVTSGYAYVADYTSGLQIIYVAVPALAYIMKSVDTPGHALDVQVTDGYAYVTDDESGLQIIDIEPPSSAYIVKSVDTPGWADKVHITGGYACVADHYGLQIIDIEPLGSAHIVKSVDKPRYTEGVHVSDGYAYVADKWYGLQIIDADPLESAYVVKSVDTPGDAAEVHVSGGYAYVTGYSGGLYIIDIEPPESAYIVKSVDTPGDARGVYVYDGYAYVADVIGLQIIDIEPPSSAYIVKSVDTPGIAVGIYAVGGYAYVADGGSGLQIIDIESPDSAYIVKSVDTPGTAKGVHVIGGYAYVADGGSGLQIINIEPLGLAYIVKSVNTYDALGVYVSGGYAYVADSFYNDYGHLQIIDIEPPNLAYRVIPVDFEESVVGVYVTGNHAYVANCGDYVGDLRIIKLW